MSALEELDAYTLRHGLYHTPARTRATVEDMSSSFGSATGRNIANIIGLTAKSEGILRAVLSAIDQLATNGVRYPTQSDRLRTHTAS